ncbi:uncharacterized protein ppk23 [Dermacentor albipictus]|uniref:uncharacterized protein ppk23 n=1 Tax=Dermacentor albipictus TaxID=60249 RepID=UPI0031FD9870
MNLHSSTVVRVLVWLCCMCGFLYQTSEIIEMYRRYPFTVTIIEEVRQNIIFPGLTVCVESWINTSRLCELYPNACTVEAQTLAEDVYQVQFEPEMRQRVALEQRDLFRCSMRSTVSSCFSFNCLEVMRMTYFRSPASMCYTVDANQWADRNHRFHKCNVPWTWGLTYTVSVAQQTVRRLPPPFASKCSDYKAAGKKDEFLGYLTQDLCIQECLIKQEMKTCRCIRPQHEYGSNFKAPTCSYQNTAICDKQITNETLTKCMKKCGAPCEETSYDVRLTSLGEDRKEKERNSFSVYVKFSSDSQKIFEYQPKLTVIEAFGYMGGYIGMWLGLSLYSVITNAEQWLRRFFIEKALKKKASLEMTNTQQPRIFATGGYTAWSTNSRSGDLASNRNVATSEKTLLQPRY